MNTLEEAVHQDLFFRKMQFLEESSTVWPHILVENIHSPASLVSKISCVLITGSTGAMGPYFVQQLSKQINIKRIVCLVRANNEEEGKCRLWERLVTFDLLKKTHKQKIQVVCGDVQEERLGLKNYEKLAKDVEMIFHFAAIVHLVQPYNSGSRMHKVNVEGTQRVLEFAVKSRLKWVAHASSVITQLSANDPCNENQPVYNLNEENSLAFGYRLSKTIADLLVSKAWKLGVPVKAFRIPVVFGESNTGQQDFTNTHNLTSLVHFLMSGKLPSLENATWPSGIPVDICAKIVLTLFFNDKSPQGFYNIFNPKVLREVDAHALYEEFAPKLRQVLEIPGIVPPLLVLNMKEFVCHIEMDGNRLITPFVELYRRLSEYEKGKMKIFNMYNNEHKTVQFIPELETLIPSPLKCLRKDAQYLINNIHRFPQINNQE